jgi:hypothetical protein
MNRDLLLLLFLITCFRLPAQEPFQSSVLFKKDKAILTSSAQKMLDEVVTYTNKLVGMKKILVKGYTDSDADSSYNASLSLKRCRAVKDYLAQMGIDSSIIVFYAFGEDFPLVENSNESNKAKNRRVDIIVTLEQKKVVIVEEPKKDRPCSRDTLVELKYGVIVSVNKCRFEQDPSCLRIGLTRYEENKIKFSKFRRNLGLKNAYVLKDRKVFYKANVSCRDTSCIGGTMRLYVPAYEVTEKKFYITRLDPASGTYKKYEEPKIKNLKKKSYVTFSMKCNPHYCDSCPGGGGMDFLVGCGGTGSGCSCKQSKLKLRNGLKAYDLNVDDYFSTVYFNGEWGVPTLRLQSDTTGIVLYNVQKSVLRHGLRRLKNCSEDRWFLFIKYHPRCEVYRKYKFGNRDIRIQKEKPWLKEKDQ